MLGYAYLMTHDISIEQVRQAVSLKEFDAQAAHLSMLPLGRPTSRPSTQDGTPRIGAVLLLLYCHQAQLHFVLTKRKSTLRAHGGQISFPGGRKDAGETLQSTALRETHEEIGVRPDDIELIAPLTEVYIPPSDFQVRPFVGWARGGKRPLFRPSPAEVEAIIEVPLTGLLQDIRRTEPRRFRGQLYDVPYFALQNVKVWGATAVMLNEVAERLKIVLRHKREKSPR